MEALFKKYFWVINLAVLAAVAWLIAQTVVDYAATKYLTVQPETASLQADVTDKKNLTRADESVGDELTTRSPFNRKPKVIEKPEEPPPSSPKCEDKECGDDGMGGSCGECPDEEQCNAEGKCEPKEEAPQACEFNVELVGTLVNPVDPSERFANISVNGNTEMVTTGSEVNDGKAEVVDILSKIVYLREGNQLCHVSMWAEKKPAANKPGSPGGRPGRGPNGASLNRPDPKTTAAKRNSPARSPNRGLAFDYSTGVKKMNEFEFAIDKQMLDEQLTDLTQLGMQARVIPNYRKGKYEGFKLVGVRPGSLYRAIGIRSGDIVRSINGKAINSPNKAMELFNSLKNSAAIELQVERRGKVETFNYSIQ